MLGENKPISVCRTIIEHLNGRILDRIIFKFSSLITLQSHVHAIRAKYRVSKKMKMYFFNIIIFKIVSGLADEDEGVNRGGETSKEEKNAFAMRVLRRVRTKLEGREPGKFVI
jgi:hypothetical protein